MPVIKGASARRQVNDAVVLDLEDLARSAERLIEEARRKAAAIVAEGQAEAERSAMAVRDAARGEGHAVGLERGRVEAMEAARPQIEALIGRWQEALERWDSERAAMARAAAEDVLTFAFELGRRIVLRRVEVDPAVVADQIAECLLLVSRPTDAEVAIHPADRPLVEEILPGLLERIGRGASVHLREDESLTRGGCVVRTAGGAIDARIETQLETVARALLP